MNTIPPSDTPSYPSLQTGWHKMIRRCRASDRALALLLCRSAYSSGNRGRFPGLRELDDDTLSRQLGLTLRQVRRLRETSPLWRWEGSDLLLFFVDATREEGQPTPESYGRRRARHAVRLAGRRRRQARREQLHNRPAEYPILDDAALQAAEENELDAPDV